MLSVSRIALTAGLMLSLAACANQKPTQSGFIHGGYTKLQPQGHDGKVLVQKPDAATLARFSNVYIEPVSTRLGKDIKPKDAKDLADLTQKALRDELGKQWTVVNAPGPRTVTIRTALTAVHKAQPAANVVLTIVAVPLLNGGLSAEGEFDGGGRRIGAISWGGEGIFNPVGYYSALGHARALTASFAKAVAKALDRPAKG